MVEILPLLAVTLLLEQIMAYSPGIPTLIREQLRTSHVEHLPAVEPHSRLVLPVRLLQAGPDLLLAGVHLAQPVLARARIVRATDPPLAQERQIVLEEMQEVGAGHGAAGEEVRAHPAVVKVVRRVPVREDVHEQPPAGLQRAADLPHQQRVVLHVLEQLDADHPVVRARWELVAHHIARDDLQIREPFPLGLALDVDPLRPRVGERGDVGLRESLRQVQARAAPSATQVQDFLSVRQARFLDVRLQHGDLRLRQRLGASRIQARRVLHPGSQTRLQHRRADFVVLGIGLVRLDSDWPGPQRRDVCHLAFVCSGQGLGFDQLCTLSKLSPDPEPDHAAWQPAVVDKILWGEM